MKKKFWIIKVIIKIWVKVLSKNNNTYKVKFQKGIKNIEKPFKIYLE